MSFSPFTPRSATPDARRAAQARRAERGSRRRWRPSGPRYFGEVLRRRSSVADRVNRSKGDWSDVGRRRPAQARRSISPASSKSASVRPPCGVRGERQAHLVPAVHEDVGVVVGRLGDLGDAVDERDRRGEVGEARGRARSSEPSPSLPLAERGQALLRPAPRREAAPSRLEVSRPRAAGAYSHAHAHRRASSRTPPSCCSRSASATEVVGGDARVRPPAGRARAAAGHARRARQPG